VEILILTHSGDNRCVEMVSHELARRGARALRLNTDRYPQDMQLSSRLPACAGYPKLLMEGSSHALDQVQACWYRRFAAGLCLPEELGDTLQACLQESQQTLYGAIASLDCFQLDPLSSVRRADHKELQLRLAHDLGLAIPATLISNDPEQVREFYAKCQGPVVTKTQTSFALYRDQEQQVVFTSQFHERHLNELDGLRYAPMMFQEMLPKARELRATVVGDQVFTAAVESSKLPGAEVDWRRKGLELIDAWSPYCLPGEVEQSLLALARSLGLNYGAADLIVTPDGRHIFLELNAGGEWFWLQSILPIAEAIAEVLIAGGEGRRASSHQLLKPASRPR